jgi:hypothetical protein
VNLQLFFVDDYIRDRARELQREAAHERLVNEAIGRGRPIRAQIAQRLYAVAQWVEGSAQPSANNATA